MAPRRQGAFSASAWQDGPNDHSSDDEATNKTRRLVFLNRVPRWMKDHLVAMISEFVGTFMFLLFAFGGTNAVNTAPAQGQPADLAANPAKLLYIALCFGMSLAVNAWVFFRISGGLFNPAVTLGLMLVGGVQTVRGLLVIVSQLIGGIAAAGVVYGILPGPLAVSTTLEGGTTIVQGLFLEMFLTAQLVFTIFMLATEKHRATFIAPVGIGLSLFIAELVGVYYTGGSLNPARSFGPAVINGEFPTYHWIYWLGPVLGALVAAGFYLLVKSLEYETVNPQQDDTGEASLPADMMSNTEMQRLESLVSGHSRPTSERRANFSEELNRQLNGVNGANGVNGVQGRGFESGPGLEAGQPKRAG